MGIIFPLSKTLPYIDPLKLLNYLRDEQNIIFLDGMNQSVKQRYSYICFDPFSTFWSKDGVLCLYEHDDEVPIDPFLYLKSVLQHYKQPHNPDLPPFQGGICGYFGYELLQHLEKIEFNKKDDMQLQDLCAGLYDFTIAFDHQEQKTIIISTGLPESEPRDRKKRAKKRIRQVKKILSAAKKSKPPTTPLLQLDITTSLSQNSYEHMVEKAKEHIVAGDIFQVNLAQRFHGNLKEGIHSIDIYQILRNQNPAPYSAYMKFFYFQLLSTSPECFLSLHNNHLISKPIKGTCARHEDKAIDTELKIQLQNDEKNCAENIMIVDLLRNDFSKVCTPESVKVDKLCEVESFANVHHLVSTITGELAKDIDPIDVLQATFPCGSITGAPKVRAMQIISELEPYYRGPYCGAHGYIGFNYEMELSVTIRTIYIYGNQLYFNAGGGIVHDSNPTAEYFESLYKADRLWQTLTGKKLI